MAVVESAEIGDFEDLVGTGRLNGFCDKLLPFMRELARPLGFAASEVACARLFANRESYGLMRV